MGCGEGAIAFLEVFTQVLRVVKLPTPLPYGFCVTIHVLYLRF